MLNVVALVGRCCNDPQIKNVKIAGIDHKVLEINMAVDRPKKEKETDFFQVQLWDKSAEIAAQYVRKGYTFGVEGRLRYESWDNQNGKGSKVFVVVSNLRLMPNGKPEDKPQDKPKEASHSDIFGSEDECPF